MTLKSFSSLVESLVPIQLILQPQYPYSSLKNNFFILLWLKIFFIFLEMSELAKAISISHFCIFIFCQDDHSTITSTSLFKTLEDSLLIFSKPILLSPSILKIFMDIFALRSA